MMKFKSLKASVLIGSALLMGSYSTLSMAQANLAIQCPGYQPAKTKLLGQKVGKKLNKAFEAYNQDLVKEAIDLLYEIEADDPFDRASVDRFLGQLLVSEPGKRAEAADYLERAVKTKILNDNDHAPIIKLVGDLKYEAGKYEEAIAWFEKWMKFTCKEDGMTYLKIANAYKEMKQLDKVIPAADKAIALLDPPKETPYAIKMSVYYDQKKYQEAIDVIETAIKVFPESNAWFKNAGLFYQITENYSMALTMLELAYYRGHLTTATQHKQLAQLYSVNGMPHRATALMEKHMKSGLIPTDKDTLSSVANSAFQAREFRTAAKYFGEAAKVANDPELYRRKGSMLLTIGDYRGAIEALKLALEDNDGNEGKVHYAMIEAHFYLGDYKAAMAAAKEAKKDSTIRKNAEAWEPYIKTKASNKGIRI
ncbi:MAG: tetratricopeptide (TPR) repeat protein [Glaciecola sp.]|jgi:tetratricopeptide (TPR) repeat protein|mmetsp:Transcript_46454/g.149022  ORF Transcript_46454/g.149022 Transcript_46454/m.149022 type:complete len:423 (-) Transcript_46454:85-1353(-)